MGHKFITIAKDHLDSADMISWILVKGFVSPKAVE